MKILGWPADNTGCGWYRIRMPLEELARRGHETRVALDPPDDWFEWCDVLIGQRLCKTNVTRIWHRLSKLPNRPLMVLELDDDLWSIPPASETAHRWFSQPGVLKNLELNIARADVVTVSTEPLAEVVRRFNANVVVVGNSIPGRLLDEPRSVEHDESRVVIGWAGSATHQPDLAEIGPEIVRTVRDNPDAVLHTIGTTATEFLGHFPWLGRMPNGRWRVTGWLADLWDYYRALDAFDVATAPLAHLMFNDAKSPIKALEAGARGLPVVASNVGPYRGYVRHGETGLLVDHPYQWRRALRGLVADADMRAELGAAGRRQAAEHTIERRGDEWEQALLSQLTNLREAS